MVTAAEWAANLAAVPRRLRDPTVRGAPSMTSAAASADTLNPLAVLLGVRPVHTAPLQTAILGPSRADRTIKLAAVLAERPGPTVSSPCRSR